MRQEFIGIVFFVVAILGILFWEKKQWKGDDLADLKKSPEDFWIRKRNFISIKKLFVKNLNYEDDRHYIDDQTWSDLEMDKVFKKLDMTLSTPGEQRLYELLRYPEMDEKLLLHRNEIIEFLQNNSETREQIREILAKMGRQNSGEILDLLYSKEKIDFNKKKLYDMFSILAIGSAISIAFLGMQGVFMLIMISMVNMYLHNNLNKEIQGSVKAITYLSDIAKASSKLCNMEEGVLDEYRKVLKENVAVADVILKNSSMIGRIEGLDFIGDYINSVFLIQGRAYFKIMSNISDSLEEIKSIYSVLGEIDAFISVAMYRNNSKIFTVPEFHKGSKSIVFVNGLNPLIIDGVPNPIHMGPKGIILTGSNMSGKSTYLRTVGVNALMAQTIATVIAEEYKGDFFKIMTSISPKDDIEQGKSYYLGEAEAVRRILMSVEEDTPVLCIIDEIFRGTNPIERVSASAEILNYLMEHNAIALVATHDLELTDIVKKYYNPYYFSELVSEKEGLDFDYTIKEGVSNTRNAIKLLKYLGYPDSIIINAEKRIDEENSL